MEEDALPDALLIAGSLVLMVAARCCCRALAVKVATLLDEEDRLEMLPLTLLPPL